MFDTASFDDVVCSEDELIHLMMNGMPSFAKHYLRYMNGDYSYEDGTQDEFLESVATQVKERLKLPTERQANAFVGQSRKLEQTKRDRGVLRRKTDKEKKLARTKTRVLLQIGFDNLDKFTKPTEELFSSFRERFRDKGSITDKQLKYLQRIVEDLPDKLLQSERERLAENPEMFDDDLRR